MENDPTDDPLVMQYFHVSAELAVTIDSLEANGAIARAEADQLDCIRLCAVCPYFQMGRCNLCGCGINLRSRITSMHCPIAKW